MKQRIIVVATILLILVLGLAEGIASNITNVTEINVLIVVGTKAGSTRETADSIAKALINNGCSVDICTPTEPINLKKYQGVIIGSAIRMGQVLPDIKKFAQNNSAELSKIPTSIYILCTTLKHDTPENRATAQTYINPLKEYVSPVSIGLFAGKMDYSKLKFFARFAAKRMVKVPEGDYRDWPQIHNFANNYYRLVIESHT